MILFCITAWKTLKTWKTNPAKDLSRETVIRAREHKSENYLRNVQNVFMLQGETANGLIRFHMRPKNKTSSIRTVLCW